MSLVLMMLTGIIEYSKCLNSRSGAMAALKKIEGKGKRQGEGVTTNKIFWGEHKV